MFGPRRPQKTYAYYRRTGATGSDVDGEGAAAPSASTPPSAKSDRASDGNTGEGSPRPWGLHRRTTSAPRPGHRRQGLLQEPGPSRCLGRPPRSLSQLSPEDTSPAHGLGSPTPGLVPPVDDLARSQPPLLRLLGLGSPPGPTKFLLQPTPPLSMLTPLPPAPAHRRAVAGFFFN